MEKDTALEACVDFILNHCSGKELDVVIAAIERRKKQLSGQFSFDAEAASKQMSEKINESIQKGMDGMTKSLRDFSADLIAQEAPELSKAQAEALVENWIPDISYNGTTKSIARDGKISGIPTELLYDMILQFVSFGTGDLPKEKDAELKAAMGNWQEKYWKKFHKKIKETIKTFFDGKTTFGEFNKEIKILLDIS